MKELYNEFFHIPKNGKIREKVMLMRTALTVIVMVVCLFAMSFTAYAYFSNNVTSGSNVIKAANFEAEVSIQPNDSNVPSPELKEVNSKTYSADLKANTEYTVVLKPGGTAKTGFCVVTAEGCKQTYHTQQLGVDQSVDGQNTPQITFMLIVSEDTTVYILSHWGTSSQYGAFVNKGTSGELYITNENVQANAVKMTIGNTQVSIGEFDEGGEGLDENMGSEETTTPTETEPVVDKHIVVSGDTLSAIAKKYGWSVKALAVYNEIENPSLIRVGDTINIPPEGWSIPETSTPTEITSSPETTTTPETTEPTEPEIAPETSSSAESNEPAETTVSVSEEETQPTEETTGTTTTEASE